MKNKYCMGVTGIWKIVYLYIFIYFPLVRFSLSYFSSILLLHFFYSHSLLFNLTAEVTNTLTHTHMNLFFTIFPSLHSHSTIQIFQHIKNIKQSAHSKTLMYHVEPLLLLQQKSMLIPLCSVVLY